MKSEQKIKIMMNELALKYKYAMETFDREFERKDIVAAAEAQTKLRYVRGVFSALFEVLHERRPTTEEIKTVDVGLGVCKRNAYCNEWAVTHYNPDLPVCKSCDESLDREFEREYQ